ncbi:Dynein assembly factor with WDR repeat domains 1 [Strongyloides ratti]|uniref:Dynein assembly factor with WDR repeat domains 1 n=1 Tax=Strongyloides ratti TaxID=34506 RepID=A0A090KZY1_STRRB|nr:Dynein assembly factor with WDR repeat domains 1 [Strongyloides ratti]CEF60759.1 Dynein assembly factor with WDR repeat domains 1 [Strongyloides ratti]
MFRVDKTIKEENVKSAGKDIIHKSSSVNNRKILLIFPTFEEFFYEKFEFVKNGIQDIQICGAALGVDIEWYTFSGNYDDFINYELLIQLLNEEHTIVICFLGNKIGYYMPPMEIDFNTFDALREKLFEMSTDVKVLDKFYTLKESKKGKKYCLQKNFLKDVLGMELLIKMLEKVKNDEHKLLKLYIKHIVEIMMSQKNSNHIYIQRRFKGMPLEENNPIFSEILPSEYEKIENLKNIISQNCDKNNIFSYILPCTSQEYDKWLTTKEGENYGINFVEKISEKIKQLIDNNCTIQIPQSNINNSLIYIDMFDITKREQVTHQQYYIQSKPLKWEKKNNIEKIIENIFNMNKNGKWCVVLKGDDGIGKTSHLLLLHETLQNDSNYISFIRFLGLTPHSIYDHEIFRNILFLLDNCTNSKQISFNDSLELPIILKNIENLIKKIDKKVYILIDNIHLLRTSKNINENFKFINEIPNLYIICTIPNDVDFNYIPNNECIILQKPTIEESIEIIKLNASKSNIKIGIECLSNLRLYLSEHNDSMAGALVVAQLLANNIPVELKKSAVINLVNHLENYYDEIFIKKLIKYFVGTSFGFTSLEVTTLFNFSCKPLSYDDESIPDLNISKDILTILTKYNMLFDCVIMDNQVVYRLKHSIFKKQFIKNYLYENGCNIKEMNQITNMEMASIYFDTCNYEENDKIVYNGYMFPQPLIRENGKINLRKVLYQWKYLLEGGKSQNLKEFTLCNFEYIEAITRANGLGYLISVFDETCEKLLDHDLLVFYLQVIIPSINTLLRDSSQIAPECIGRLRYTRESNSHNLNSIVEQAMAWVDMYDSSPLLVPLTCWISPPKMDEIFKTILPNWSGKEIIAQPTINYQNILLTGNSEDPNMIYLYNISSHSTDIKFSGHTKKVTCLSISCNGINFASGSFDGTIKIWDLYNIDNVKTFQITKAKINCCLYSHNSKFIASGTTDSIASVIDIESGEIIATFPEHTGSVICLQLTSNDEFLIVGSGDFAVMVYNIEDKCLISKLEGLMAPVTCMSLTTNDAFVVVACEDETVRVYSLISSQELHELSGHDCRVSSIAVSADDCQIFVGIKSKIICYDLHNSQIIDTLECGEKLPIGSIQTTHDNSFIIAGCGRELHMWNIQCSKFNNNNNNFNNNNCTCEVTEDNSICCVKMSPDEKSTCCGTVSGVIALWDLEVCQCIWTQTHKIGSAITAIEFTDDSFYLISGCSEGQMCLWEADKGQLIKIIKIHTLSITTLYFIGGSIPTYKVFSCDKGNNSHIWNLTPLDDSPNFFTVLISFSDVESPILFKKHQKLILGEFSKNRNEIQIYHVYDESVNLKGKAYHTESITCYNFDRNEKILVTGSKDQSLKIWQLENGYLTQVLVGHDSAVTCCAVNDNGNIVVSNSKDKNLIIWDAKTGTVKSSIETCHLINIVEITADGLVIITADTNGWIEAWSSAYGILLSSFNTYNTISSLLISVDSNRIVCPLINVPQLPILCLHNTPAGIIQRHMTMNDKSLHRINSAASYTSTVSESRPKTSKKPPSKLENGRCIEENGKKVNENYNIKKSQSLTVASPKAIIKSNGNNSQQNLKLGGENVRFRDNASIVSHAPASYTTNSKTGKNGEQLKSTLCSIL